MITGSKYCKTPGCHTQNEQFDSHLGTGTCLGLCQVCSSGIPTGRMVRGDPQFGAAIHAGPSCSHLHSYTALHPSRWELLIKSLIKAPDHSGLIGS